MASRMLRRCCGATAGRAAGSAGLPAAAGQRGGSSHHRHRPARLWPVDTAAGPHDAGWVPEALAVADHLGIGPFAAVGISTGGAYALALAALAPARVLGVVACCSMTDMRWPQGRATMSWPHVRAVWRRPAARRPWMRRPMRTARMAARCAAR